MLKNTIPPPGRSSPQLSPRKRVLFWAISIVGLVLTAEVLANAVLYYFLIPRAQFLFYQPDPKAITHAWPGKESMEDQELGWPSAEGAASPPRDPSGAKRNPDFPDPAIACAAAYGDSFVWGDDVPLDEGWVEHLSRVLGCRVSNFAIPGYGTDQSYLRFRRISDNAPVHMLGIFPENIMRNVNQYRVFLWGTPPDPALLKGRFEIDRAGGLVWSPRPRLNQARFKKLHFEPMSIVPNEYFLPDSHDGPVTVRFPAIATLIRVALMPRVLSRLTGRPSWAEFYSPDHPSGAFSLTAEIAEAFVREAEARGKHGFVVMMLGASSFKMLRLHGTLDYAPFLKELAKRNVDVYDPSADLIAALDGRTICDLFADPSACEGHYGRDGTKIVADVVARELRRRSLVP